MSDDSTVIRPGGRRPGRSANEQMNPAQFSNQSEDETVVRGSQQGRNTHYQQDAGIFEGQPERYRDPQFDPYQNDQHAQHTQRTEERPEFHRSSQPEPDRSSAGLGTEQPYTQRSDANFHAQHNASGFNGAGFNRTHFTDPYSTRASNQAASHNFANAGNFHNSENQIVDLVMPLLVAASAIPDYRGDYDLADFRREAESQIRFFESQHFNSPDTETMYLVSYCLCAFIDDVILNSHHGANSFWGRAPIVGAFHRETHSGTIFFDNLEALYRIPAKNLEVIELYYLALSLGFVGKYRYENGGERELQRVTQNAFQVIERHRGSPVKALSLQYKGAGSRKRGLMKVLPQWVIWSACAGLGGAIFLGFNMLLWEKGDPVVERIQSMYQSPPITVLTTPPSALSAADIVQEVQPDLQPTDFNYLSFFQDNFSADIQQGLLTVIENPSGAILRIGAGSLFSSGRAQVAADKHAFFARVGQALNDVPGRITVVGHTDNVAIRTARYPNNYALSSARAESVLQLVVAELVNKRRIHAKGVADTENIAPNDSAQNQALNRRIEIVLKR